MYSGFKENRVLFANTINSGFVRKAEVASVSEDGHIRYASVFSHENIMLLKKFSEFNENGTSKDATDDDGWEYDVSPQQEAQLNEHILSVWLQKLGVVDSQVLLQQVFNDQIDARSDRATPNSATQMVSESSEAKTQGTEILALGLSSEIQKYLLTTQLMEHEIVKLTKNEVSSAAEL